VAAASDAPGPCSGIVLALPLPETQRFALPLHELPWPAPPPSETYWVAPLLHETPWPAKSLEIPWTVPSPLEASEFVPHRPDKLPWLPGSGPRVLVSANRVRPLGVVLLVATARDVQDRGAAA
jgi:hypothetical protein